MSPVTVAVVGSGVAGLSAALEATRAGAAVTILESADAIGGASAISGGGMCLVDTVVQRRLGLSDSVELALEDWARVSAGLADLAWADRYLRASPDLWTFLETLGLRWQPVVRKYPDNSVPRWHRPEGGGGAVISALQRALDDRPVQWRTGHRVMSLTPAADRVTVGVRTRSGEDTVVADAVVLAAGGFANDSAMIRALLPTDSPYAGAPFLTGGGPEARGDLHRIATRIGAQLVNPGNVWFYPVGVANYRCSGTDRGLVVRGIFSDVWVNADGERFHDERDRGGRAASLALAEQPGSFCWGVQSAAEAERLVLLDDPYFGSTETTLPARRAEFLACSPDVVRAPSPTALAARIGVPALRLRDAIAQHDESARRGDRSDFLPEGVRLQEIGDGEVVAIRYRLIAQKTFGGLQTDAECRVLDTAGRPIPGVFACGELAGMAGGHINGAGAIEGTMFGPCLFSGRVAGATAARPARSPLAETINRGGLPCAVATSSSTA